MRPTLVIVSYAEGLAGEMARLVDADAAAQATASAGRQSWLVLFWGRLRGQ